MSCRVIASVRRPGVGTVKVFSFFLWGWRDGSANGNEDTPGGKRASMTRTRWFWILARPRSAMPRKESVVFFIPSRPVHRALTDETTLTGKRPTP
jgi:hypothetical protein